MDALNFESTKKPFDCSDSGYLISVTSKTTNIALINFKQQQKTARFTHDRRTDRRIFMFIPKYDFIFLFYKRIHSQLVSYGDSQASP